MEEGGVDGVCVCVCVREREREKEKEREREKEIMSEWVGGWVSE